MDYIVGIEQRKPYEVHVIETFTEEVDALDYAGNYADGHGYNQISQRRWKSAQETGQYLFVMRR